MYRIQTLHGRQAAVLTPHGILGIEEIVELKDALESILEQSIYEVVVDLSQVGIISSAGWGVFISRLPRVEKSGGHLRFAGMSSEVHEVFGMLGLSRSTAVTSHDDVNAAIQACASRTIC